MTQESSLDRVPKWQSALMWSRYPGDADVISSDQISDTMSAGASDDLTV